jgi:tRNA pseudouridine38-40 synthase
VVPPDADVDPGPARDAGTQDGAPPGTRRWRLTIAYDGAPFRGFAAQTGATTVAGTLAEALGRLARSEAPRITCAGRTDAGVHARGQVVHVDLPRGFDTDPGALARSLNRQLAPSVVVRDVAVARAGFDARRSATARHYRYLVFEAPAPDPLFAPVSWHVTGPLDLRRMATSADALIGEHDFRAFCRRAPGTGADEPIVRVVTSADWREVLVPAGVVGRLLRFDISAGSFCHQMVRSLVAALVAAGLGRATPASLVARLRAASREGTEKPAPPHGLCLVGVDYPA